MSDGLTVEQLRRLLAEAPDDLPVLIEDGTYGDLAVTGILLGRDGVKLVAQ